MGCARSAPTLLLLALLGCASPGARWPGWTTLERGHLRLEAPGDLQLVDLGEGRFRLERSEGLTFMEARLSAYCPDAAEPGMSAVEPGRFASPLGGLPGGEDRFFSIVAGRDQCLLLRFFGLWDAGERNAADRIAASVRWER